MTGGSFYSLVLFIKIGSQHKKRCVLPTHLFLCLNVFFAEDQLVAVILFNDLNVNIVVLFALIAVIKVKESLFPACILVKRGEKEEGTCCGTRYAESAKHAREALFL